MTAFAACPQFVIFAEEFLNFLLRTGDGRSAGPEAETNQELRGMKVRGKRGKTYQLAGGMIYWQL